MPGAHLSGAESDFFQALLGTEKLAEPPDRDKLAPGTRLLLGVQEADVGHLSELEDRASSYDDSLRSPEEVDQDQRKTEHQEVFGEPQVQQVADTYPPPEVDEEPVEGKPTTYEPETVDENLRDEEIVESKPVSVQAKPKPEPPGRERFAHLFSIRRAHPIVMAEVLRGRYKDAWVTWEPETLWSAIRRDFGPVGDIARNKIMALRVALQTGYPWTDWDVFENCGVAWNDHIPMFGAYQPMPPSEAAFTVIILKQLHPEFEFENEVEAYLGAICEEAGLVLAPQKWFPGAQRLINRKPWIIPLRIDVKKVWSRIKNETVDQIGKISFRPNNPLDINIGKLIAVREYLAARDMERREQKKHKVRRITATPEPIPVA